MALHPELSHFALIVPCGMSAARATSIHAETHHTHDLEALARVAAVQFAERWTLARPRFEGSA